MKFLVGALLLAATIAVTCSDTGSDVTSTNEEPATLECLLAEYKPEDCDVGNVVLPKRVIELYHSQSSRTKSSVITQLPATLVYLLPMHVMLTISGSNLGLLLQKHRTDVAMAVKISRTVMMAGPEVPMQFLDKLIGTELPVQTQHLLGDLLFSSWPNLMSGDNEETRAVIFQGIRVGTPLLAYLPASKVRELHGKLAEKFLFHLRIWDTGSLRSWSENSKLVRRVWAELVFREIYSQWRPEEVKGFEFLLSGATPSEIRTLTKEQFRSLTKDRLYEKGNVFRLSAYDKLQARALFSAVYSDAVLTSANLTDLLPIVTQLSPRDLQHFAVNATDFRMIIRRNSEEKSSFAADKQIGEFLMAQAVLQQRLPSADTVSSYDKLKEREIFAYTLPPGDFQIQHNASSREWSKFLMSIDSDKLSRKQAWLVTNQGTLMNPTDPSSVLGLRGLLKAIPTSQFIKYQTGELPHNVLDYLAASLPNFEPSISADLLHKLRPELDEDGTLESLLKNDDPNQFFTLLSSRETSWRKNEIFAAFKLLWKMFQTKVENLPQHFLSTLLQSTRIRSSPWKAHELTEHVAFMGLSCNVIDTIDSVDAIEVLSQYNGKLLAARKSFPKDLQYCTQKLVYRYLSEKIYIREAYRRRNVLEYLEPVEIQAIGGYVLASIPPHLIEGTVYHSDIVHSIGQLPLLQLWEATGRKTYLERFTQLALKGLVDVYRNFQLETYELLRLGSFVPFLTKDSIERIAPSAFKFYLEARGDESGKTLCCNLEERKAWYQLIKMAFGPSSRWTATTLSTLGDWLVAVPYEALDKVPSKHWVAAVDDLVERTSYHRELSWPAMAEPVMFAKVCSQVFNQDERQSYEETVNSLLNRYLLASQSLLDTIVSARKLVASSKESNSVVTMAGVKVLKPALEVEVIQTVQVDLETAKETSEENVSKASTSTTLGVNATTPGELEQTSDTQLIQGVPSSTEDVTISADTSSTTESMPTPAETSSSTADLAVQPDVSIVRDNLQTPPDATDGTTPPMSESEESVTASTPLPATSVDDSSSFDEDATRLVKRALRTSKNLKEKRKTSALETSVILQAQKIDNDNRTRRKITCDAIRALGSRASLALQIIDVDQMNTEELVNCLETLGELQLSNTMHMVIWRRMRKENKTVLITDLPFLGHLVQTIEKEDIDHLDLSLSSPNTLDVLSVLGREVPHGRLLEQLAERFYLNNTGEANIGPATLIAMGRIICEITLNTVRKLMGSSFLHVVTSLGQAISVQDVSQCPMGCMDHLVRLAMEDNALGSPDTWTAEDISNLGAISAGLLGQKWQIVNASAMYGLTPNAVKCIVPQVFKEFSIEQLLHLSPLTAAIVSSEQLAQLSNEQYSALTQVRDLVPISPTQPQEESASKDSNSGAAAVGMNVCGKDRQIFLKYLRNEMFVLICILLYCIVLVY